jgi:hypothetical protein
MLTSERALLGKKRAAATPPSPLPFSDKKAGLGIGVEKTNAGIGIPASRILVRYRTTKMPDCVSLDRLPDLFRYR